MILPPPQLEHLQLNDFLIAGNGTSAIISDFDFETYSPAGFIWNENTNKWDAPHNAIKKGLGTVGTVRYTEDVDAEVLCLAYNLKDGIGPRLWVPGAPNPQELFDHIGDEKLLEAWNVTFEYWVWKNICVKKYGWPELPIHILRCAMAKARAFCLPGGLDATAKVLKLSQQKDKRGTALLNKFSIPRNPTKTDARKRLALKDFQREETELYSYCLQDIATEAEASSKIPDLSEFELAVWQLDQKINSRGVAIDIESIKSCIEVLEKCHDEGNTELKILTEGTVSKASETKKLLHWLQIQDTSDRRGFWIDDLTDATITEKLKLNYDHPSQPPVSKNLKRALEIRQMLASTSVKKLYTMMNQVSSRGRLHNLFIYHSARTGRAAGAGVQPQNLPSQGPSKYPTRWDIDAVEFSLKLLNSKDLNVIKTLHTNPIELISSCLRALFIPAQDHDFICSDFASIEAVVLAAIAGEEWRLEVFRTHGKIYEMSASKISNVPFSEFEKHKITTGEHHPLRKKIGKVAELAGGYQGWIGAWRQFGADDYFKTEDEIKHAILAWRKENPKICQLWEELENAAQAAVRNRGTKFTYRGISYHVKHDILYCGLPSGRFIAYHKPKLGFNFKGNIGLSFEGWNTNPKNGATGWTRMDTYGGRLTENVVQAIARDILMNSLLNLEKAGYPIVLHVHDEACAEVPENFGSIQEFEEIMSSMPSWAHDWPIKAKGGWRGKRYRKD